MDGTLTTAFSLKLLVNGVEFHGGIEARIDKAGRPLKQTFSESGRGKSSKIVRTWGPTSVTVVKTENGKTSTVVIPIPKGKQVADPSDFWLVRDMPKKGAVVRYWHLDTKTNKWLGVQTTYTGTVQVQAGSRKVFAHKIIEGGDSWETYLDAKGMPLKMSMGGMDLIRQ